MREAVETGPGRPPPAFRAVWLAALGASSAAVCACDLLLTARHLAGQPSGRALGGAAALVLAGTGVAAAVTTLLLWPLILLRRHRPGVGRGRRWMVAAAFAVLPALGTAWVARELSRGAWISAQSWAAPARSAAWVAAAAGWWALALTCVRRRESGRAAPRTWIVILTAALPALMLADRHLLARQYAAFHLALVVAFVVAAALLGVSLHARGHGRWVGRTGLVALVAGVLAAILVVAGRLPGDDLFRRDLLLARAPVTSRVLGLLPRRIDGGLEGRGAEILARLKTRTPCDPGRLDAALPGRRRLRVVMVTIDTLRHDHVSFLGYHRPTTPELDGLAAESVVFTDAYSQFPSSSLAMASLLGGLYPTATEAYRLDADERDPANVSWPSWPQRLAKAGWRTAAVTTLPVHLLDGPMFYVRSGFDELENVPPVEAGFEARAGDLAIEAVGGAGAKPMFFWLHLFSPHAPYSRHARHDFGPDAVDRYDAEIAAADEQLGRLLSSLRPRDDWERTVVIVNADHGEEFGDHGGVGHHSSVYDEQVRVPLFVRIPGIAPRRIADPVELIDLMPTVLELAGLDGEPAGHGRSLLPLIVPSAASAPAGADPPLPPTAFMQFRPDGFSRRGLDAVRVGGWKLVFDRGAATYHLFDLARDPKEIHDLAAGEPARLSELKDFLAAHQRLARGDGDGGEAGDELLRAPEGETPREALARLTKLADRERYEEAAERLCALALAPGDDAVRARALDLVGRLPGVVRLEPLAPLLDASSGLRCALARLLVDPDDGLARSWRERLARDADVRVRAAAWTAAACAGEPGAAGRLRALLGSLAGADLLRAVIALAHAGEGGFEGLAAGVLDCGFDDPRWFVPAARAAAARADAHSLVALYTRTFLAPPHRLSEAALVEAWLALPVRVAVPVWRRLLVHHDERVVARARAALDEWGSGAQVDELIAIERALRRARETFGSGRDLAAAAEAEEIFRRAVELGYVDWGIAREVLGFSLRQGHVEAAARRLDAMAATEGPGRAIVKRLADVARHAGRPAVLELSWGAHDPALVPGRAPSVAVVRLRCNAGSGSVPGSLYQWAPRLAIGVTHRAGGTRGRPHVQVLPSAGVLPGEEIAIVAAFIGPDVPAGPCDVNVAVVLQTRVLGAGSPLLIPCRR